MRSTVARWLIGGAALTLLMTFYIHLGEHVPWLGSVVGGLFFGVPSVVFGETFFRLRAPRRKG